MVLDITGAKKSMIAGAFLAAGFLELRTSYVDFASFHPVLRRPLPGSCRPVELRHPYALFRLRDESRLREAFADRRPASEEPAASRVLRPGRRLLGNFFEFLSSLFHPTRVYGRRRPPPGRTGAAGRGGRWRTMIVPSYVSGDVRSIQGYVFRSSRLLEMRGGSALLDFFDRAVIRRLVERRRGDLVFSGGGNFLALFDGPGAAERSAKLADAARTAFLDLTGEPGLTVARLDSEAPFDQARARLAEELRRRKRAPEEAFATASMPFLKRCESCGRESADRLFPGPQQDDPDQWLGPVCARKREMHRRLRQAAKKGEAALHPVLDDDAGRQLELRVPAVTGLLDGAELPADFQELVGEDDLAIVAADGNGLGAWFEGLDRPAYGRLSAAIDAALRSALDGAVGSVFGEGKPRVQVLICGGDDLVAALPARAALPFAAELLERFEVTHPRDPERRAGIAAGLLLCRQGFPFRPAHDLAVELLGRAKDRCRRDGLPAALAWHRAAGSHVQSLGRELAAVERDDGGRKGWSYGAAGPYSLDELRRLQALRRRLAAVPASQRGRLREILSPRGDGAETHLDPGWLLPARVVAELRSWWLRLEEGRRPFDWPEAKPPPELVRDEVRRVGDRDRSYRRLVLADALTLADRYGGSPGEPREL